MSDVSIGLLYPDLLGTYGDGGNATVLARRLEWRGITSEILPVSLGDPIPESCNIYLLGGGEDQPQTAVADALIASGALHRAADQGAVVFAVCAGMQVLGHSFAVAGDDEKGGIGLLDITTERGRGPRPVGEIAVDLDPDFGSAPLSGYENHGGVTRLGREARRLGTVTAGFGNHDGRGSEGAVQGMTIGTYLHGPALARNAHLADLLLSWATGQQLAPVDDTEIDALRAERLARGTRFDRGTSLLSRFRR